MKIGILTGGGDVPGLNACIKIVVGRAAEEGHEVLGVRRGWRGLLHYDADDPTSFDKHFMTLNKVIVRPIDRTGGTFLHTSRTNPGNVRAEEVPDFLKTTEVFREHQNKHKGRPDAPSLDFTEHVLNNLAKLGITHLVVIGGDDTLSYAERIHSEGFPVIAIPKTMDNDVYGTDFCIGFGTAVTRSVQFIHQLRSSAGSHERIAVIELFGRNSGETSLISSYLAGVDRALIAEVPFHPERLTELLMRDRSNNPSNYAMVTISEGTTMIGGSIIERGEEDAYGHRKLGGIGQLTADTIKSLTGVGIIFQQLAYLMRSGAPDALDLMVAVNFANMALDLIMRGKSGRMCALRDGVYTHIPLSDTKKGLKRVDVEELYDKNEYRPKIWHVLGKPMFLY
ncbi:MAG: phosphofructokinase [Deltaproteobacteria bacterium]|nr:phosphofructokinase [Deltaproteobacteria bacterium]